MTQKAKNESEYRQKEEETAKWISTLKAKTFVNQWTSNNLTSF